MSNSALIFFKVKDYNTQLPVDDGSVVICEGGRLYFGFIGGGRAQLMTEEEKIDERELNEI